MVHSLYTKLTASTQGQIYYSIHLCCVSNLWCIGGPPKKTEFIFFKLCIYSNMFKFQSPSKYSPFDAIHLLRLLFYCSEQFLNLTTLMPFSASAIFCFTSSTWQNVSLWGLFSSVETKRKSCSVGRSWVNRKGGAPGLWCFWSKTAEHSAWCGQVHSSITHHDMGNHTERVIKKIHWSQR